MINADSRYAQSTVTTVAGPTGSPWQGDDIATIVAGEQDPYSFNYNTYQLTGYDRIDNLAYRFYGDATKWWQIADGNPQILDWSNVPAGTVIRVPFV